MIGDVAELVFAGPWRCKRCIKGKRLQIGPASRDVWMKSIDVERIEEASSSACCLVGAAAVETRLVPYPGVLVELPPSVLGNGIGRLLGGLDA